MRAVVVVAPQKIEVVDDWPEPQCGVSEVIVEISGTGICGTDLAYVHGERSLPPEGLIVGHEAFGRIVQVGANVDSHRVGQRVAIEPNYPCNTCVMCATMTPSLCTARRSPVVTEQGFLAERVAVPAAFAWQLPDEMSDEDAACIEPLAVAMGAIRRAGDITARPRIAIVGAGSIGKIMADVLVRRGLSPAMIDISSARLDSAAKIGARTARANESFDLIFESSGNAAALTQVIERLAPRGMVVVVGVSNDQFSVDMKSFVRKGITLIGSMIYDHPHDYRAVIEAISRGEARPGRVLSAPHTLDDAPTALLAARSATEKTWMRVCGCQHG